MGIVVILIATIVISILTSMLIITFIDQDEIEAAQSKIMAERENSGGITADAKNAPLKASKKTHTRDGMVCKRTPLTEPLLLIGDSKISH